MPVLEDAQDVVEPAVEGCMKHHPSALVLQHGKSSGMNTRTLYTQSVMILNFMFMAPIITLVKHHSVCSVTRIVSG